MEQEFTFSQLFEAYKSAYSNKRMNDEQNNNLRKLHEKQQTTGITLSQSDAWMMQAGLIKKKVLSLTDTGMIFSKFRWIFEFWRFQKALKSRKHFRRFSLNEDEFLKYLETLADVKKFDLEEVKTKLMLAGLPEQSIKFEFQVIEDTTIQKIPESETD